MSEVDGTVVVSGETALIAFERRLNHPIEAVWDALTDPEERAAWLGRGTVEPHVGGQVSIMIGPADRAGRQRPMVGRVLAWDPPRVLEHEWDQPGLAVSIVRWELAADGDRTVLKLTHRRSVAPGATGGRAGWHAFLDRLTARLDGQPVPDWGVRRAEVQDAYGEAPLAGAGETGNHE